MAARASRWLARAAGAAAALAVAGCSSVSDMASYTFVLSDRYVYSSCKEIADNRGVQVSREKELVGLIEKADSGLGGFIVSTATYRSELVQVRAHLKALAKASQEKGCDAPAKPG
jgi:hypothetical protein